MENLDPQLLIEHRGHIFPIIWRKKGAKEGKTDKCPFCGSTHLHGSSPGHRIAHCSTKKAKNVEIDGTIYLQKEGYFIKEY